MYLVIIAVLDLTLITLIHWRAFMSWPNPAFFFFQLLSFSGHIRKSPVCASYCSQRHQHPSCSDVFLGLCFISSTLSNCMFSLITEQSTAQLSFLLHLILCSKGSEAMNAFGTMLIVDGKTCGQRERTARSRMLSPPQNWLGRGTASIKKGKGLYPPPSVCPCKWWVQFCS